ncbi:hypothetical protein GMORB2_3890 [Geosmithia morbida]|uniref:GID complex catalytic subunit 2 n=1 Tax=Geosmithia morbida TaxID=1094350 RepID=A0A9P4Z097_9HYPO|nr:uncharacterized protein GMORB2_3890 [Geosmithia morbida]KAF4125051.1 hypothetical protein GMORB2_3890 [Geosmithia morbida]
MLGLESGQQQQQQQQQAASPFKPLEAELARMRRSNLTAAIDDVDKVIELLQSTRDQVAQEADDSGDPELYSHKVSSAMTSLQNPVRQRLDAITDDLKDVTKAQRSFGKALDKAMPVRELPTQLDTMAQYADSINHAITMHLLREGQFSVAETFREEVRQDQEANGHINVHKGDKDDDDDKDLDMDANDNDLRTRFMEMYEILDQLRSNNLLPAIEWARIHSRDLEAKGSSLEFDLSRLQFIWLFRGRQPSAPGSDAGSQSAAARAQAEAFDYSRRHFAPFQRRHLKEIAQLCAAVVYAPNLRDSPYGHLFQVDAAFDDVALSFTRDFCSLLGLSAESPLYVAVTAGAISLPRLVKFTGYLRDKRTEWTTENELAFETPLPASMIYHPIFVCPVSKEQTTEANPPIMLSCGHVISRESLHNIAKGPRYKCPYCPVEGYISDTLRIYL